MHFGHTKIVSGVIKFAKNDHIKINTSICFKKLKGSDTTNNVSLATT